MLWNVRDILTATKGRLLSQSSSYCGSIVMDSREVSKDSLFLCFRGPHNDGHAYIEQAIKSGASIILGTDESALQQHSHVTTILVQDTLQALVDMAKLRRMQFQGRLATITGSFGKTSTKEWVASICKNYGITVATQKSYNSFPGVPFTLANIPADANYAIIEIGMNHPGEIRPLAELCMADVAGITTIGSAHIEYMGSLEAIAEEKSDIFCGVDAQKAVAIFPADLTTSDIIRAKLASLSIQKTIGFGTSEKSALQLKDLKSVDAGYEVTITLNSQAYTYHLNLVGNHWVHNSLCVIGICHALGLSIEQILTHISDFAGLPGRGLQHLIKLKNGGMIRVLNDCYNAGPESMKAAIETLSLSTVPDAAQGRKIAVLGDMYEQGSLAERNHAKLAEILIDKKIDLVYGSGALMKHMFDALPLNMRGYYDTNSDATNLAHVIAQNVRSGDVILIKGSRGPKILRGRMSVVVDALFALGEETTNLTKGPMQNVV